MKKIFFIFIFLWSFWYSYDFEYWNEILSIEDSKYDTVVSKIKKYEKNVSKTEKIKYIACKKKKEEFGNLIRRINKIIFKYKKKKEIYAYLAIIKKISLHKYRWYVCNNAFFNKKINKKDYVLYNSMTTNSFIPYEYSYSSGSDITSTPKKYWEILETYDNIFHIWDEWYSIVGSYKLSTVAVKYFDIYEKKIKNDYKDQNVYYERKDDKITFYIVDPKIIKFIWSWNINFVGRSIDQMIGNNRDILDRLGINYIWNIVVASWANDSIYTNVIFADSLERLYYYIQHWGVVYSEIDIDVSFRELFTKLLYYWKWGKYVYIRWNKMYFLSWAINIFPIWYKKHYKNVSMDKLLNILSPTFFWISYNKFKYSVNDMYKIMQFAKTFNKQSLSDLHLWVTKNFKYNKEIEKIILTRKFSNQEINDYIIDHTNAMQNFNMFYSFDNKEWVCETISEIISILSLFNGLKSDIVTWIYEKDWYNHQISIVEDYYLDPTFDLWQTNFKYFGMLINEVKDYLILN